MLTDAFPPHQRGLALGINVVAAIGGQFLGLLIGGLLADTNWRLVFWINVPFGLVGTVWAYLEAARRAEPGDPPHRLGRQRHLRARPGADPDRHHLRHPALWQPGHGLDAARWCWRCSSLGFVCSGAVRAGRARLPSGRCWISGCSASRRSPTAISPTCPPPIARGGLQFMLIIWLQGIWLPLHGYSFEETPLWSAIFMLPLTAGFLIAGPLAGYFSDRIGGVPFAVGGMVLGGGELHRADGAAGGFLLCAVRRAAVRQRAGVRPVRGAEQHADHERRAAARARPGLRHARHHHQCRPGAVDRRVLQPDAGRARRDPAAVDGGRAARAARAARRSRTRSPRRRRWPACSRPSSATTRWAS